MIKRGKVTSYCCLIFVCRPLSCLFHYVPETLCRRRCRPRLTQYLNKSTGIGAKRVKPRERESRFLAPPQEPPSIVSKAPRQAVSSPPPLNPANRYHHASSSGRDRFVGRRRAGGGSGTGTASASRRPSILTFLVITGGILGPIGRLCWAICCWWAPECLFLLRPRYKYTDEDVVPSAPRPQPLGVRPVARQPGDSCGRRKRQGQGGPARRRAAAPSKQPKQPPTTSVRSTRRGYYHYYYYY